MNMSHDDIEILKGKVDKILNYLHNDDKTSQKGLVAEVHDLRTDFTAFVTSYKTEQSYKKGIVAAIGFIGGGLGYLAGLVIKHLF